MGSVLSGWLVAHDFGGGVRGFFVGLGWGIAVLAACFIAFVAFDEYEGHAMAPVLLLPFLGLGVLGGAFTGRRATLPPKDG